MTSVTIVDDITKVKATDRSTYISSPIMTKYEFDQVIGLRTMHLSRGATPLVALPENYKITTNMELRNIAQEELLAGRLPYLVKRLPPNGKKPEYWRINDMDLVAVKHLIR